MVSVIVIRAPRKTTLPGDSSPKAQNDGDSGFTKWISARIHKRSYTNLRDCFTVYAMTRLFTVILSEAKNLPEGWFAAENIY